MATIEEIQAEYDAPWQPSWRHGSRFDSSWSTGVVPIDKLVIDTPGIYENIIVDAGFNVPTTHRAAIHIRSNFVILRNFIVLNSQKDAIKVGDHSAHPIADTVRIENGYIHHCMNSSGSTRLDVHGITGSPTNCKIFNVDIGYVSGDCIQFDPDRRAWGPVWIEQCSLWQDGLETDYFGPFLTGVKPGENALDTKAALANPTPFLYVTGVAAWGWQQPSLVTLSSAYNCKENSRIFLTDCVGWLNQVGFRMRGADSDGRMIATMDTCAMFDCAQSTIRYEDDLKDLTNATYFTGGTSGELYEQDATAQIKLHTGDYSSLESIPQGQSGPVDAPTIAQIQANVNSTFPSSSNAFRFAASKWRLKPIDGYELEIRRIGTTSDYDVYGLENYVGTNHTNSALAANKYFSRDLVLHPNSQLAPPPPPPVEEVIAVAAFAFQRAKEAFFKAEYDPTTDPVYAMLVNNYTVDEVGDNVYADVSGVEVTGTAYTAGGKQCTSVTVTRNDGTQEIVISCANIVWSASTITADGAIFYFNPGAGDKVLITYQDFGSDRSSAGDNFTLNVSADGFYKNTL